MEKLQGIFWYGDFENYYLGHQFSEIYKDRIYEPYLEKVKDAVVLDIGANIGVFTLYASKYAKQVYSVEPSLTHFNALSVMLKQFVKPCLLIMIKPTIFGTTLIKQCIACIKLYRTVLLLRRYKLYP